MRSGCKRIVNGILWIKVKLGEEVALGPGHIVLDGDPALLTPKGAYHPQFWPMYCGRCTRRLVMVMVVLQNQTVPTLFRLSQ